MPRPSRLRLSLSMLALVVSSSAYSQSATAQSQIHRCAAGDGTTIYTDRRCEDMGAIERLPDNTTRAASPVYRDSCPRNLQDLVYQLSSAIDSGDVNRLASVYYWTGQSTRSGYALMRRLEAIARRPLADIVPVYPIRAETTTGTGDDIDAYYPQTTVRQTPIGLRLEQTLSNGSTPSRTVFGLRRSYGCWWVRL